MKAKWIVIIGISSFVVFCMTIAVSMVIGRLG